MKRSCSIVTFNHGFTTRFLRQQWAGQGWTSRVRLATATTQYCDGVADWIVYRRNVWSRPGTVGRPAAAVTMFVL